MYHLCRRRESGQVWWTSCRPSWWERGRWYCQPSRAQRGWEVTASKGRGLSTTPAADQSIIIMIVIIGQYHVLVSLIPRLYESLGMRLLAAHLRHKTRISRLRWFLDIQKDQRTTPLPYNTHYTYVPSVYEYLYSIICILVCYGSYATKWLQLFLHLLWGDRACSQEEWGSHCDLCQSFY